MPYAHNGDAQLYYEAFGETGRPAVLLLAGAGRQLLDYDDAFCGALVQAGFRAIRMDSRDVGLSTAFPDRPPRLVETYRALNAGTPPPPQAYGVDGMARDALAVLDAAGEATAHLFGRSLGALVAQAVALARPERVLSLTLAIAFSRSLAQTLTEEGLERIERAAFADEDAFVQAQLRTARAVGSPAHQDRVEIEALARQAFRRGLHPGSTARHFAVGLAAQDLRRALRQLALPTMIFHGALDRVIPLAFAKETAAAIAGARLEVIADMAHDGPRLYRPRWIEAVRDNAARAQAAN